MQSVNIIRKSGVVRTPRVMQLEGIFDLPPADTTEHSWDVELPAIDDSWQIGLIVGPSGCGKSVIIDDLFPGYISKGFIWDNDKATLDAFPKTLGIKEIVSVLNSVGFSSPTSWVKPYHVLSNGEKFRVDMARMITESKGFFVVDEFTSVVDRTVAQIGSAAIANTIRKSGKKFIAATCHYDVEDWLQPDWVYEPHKQELKWRSLWRRPEIKLKIIRTDYRVWNLFGRYHYLNTSINKGCRCFVAVWGEVPVAMVAILPFPHYKLKNMWRGHRLVCLPDYQGVGIGNQLSNFVGSLCGGIGKRYRVRLSHPAVIKDLAINDKWKIVDIPKVGSVSIGRVMTPLKDRKTRHHNILTRHVVSAEYIGPPLDSEKARGLWNAEKFYF